MLARRDFLKAAAAGVAVTGSGNLLRSASARPSKDAGGKLRFAVCGVNNRGNSHISGLRKDGGAVITHICDVDSTIGPKVCDKVAEWQGTKPEFVVNYRDLLDADKIDGITFATPNHQHALQACEALEAGLHVYVEKPVSHNVWEGRQIVNAQKASGKICQYGAQSRSSQSLMDALAFVRDGRIGDIKYAVGTCYKARMPIGQRDTPLEIPDHIDFDLWTGPAELQPIMRPKLHYDWHWLFNTGNGDMGNQGIHQMDIARWFLGEDKLSPKVMSVGGRVGYEDAGDTPNTQTVIHGYEKPLIFETRGLPKSSSIRPKWSNGDDMDTYRGSRIGVMVQCEDGYVVIPNYVEATAYDNDGKKLDSWKQGGDSTARHVTNFLNAIREDDESIQNGHIRDGHISSALCHTGAVSHLTGRNASASEIRSAVGEWGDLFADSYDRMAEHLEKNEVPIADGALTLGANLTMDPETELFTGEGAEAANNNLQRKREYRDGFVVKEYS